MNRYRFGPRRPLRKQLILSAGALSVAAALIVLPGCSAPASSGSGAQPPAAAMTASQASSTTKAMAGMGSTDSTAAKCGDCSHAARPETTTASATMEGGVQVIEVSLVNGYYRPNAITAKAGIPIQVHFDGTAMGCLAHPKFESLNKKADMTKGSTTLELGALKAGTYPFSCSMDVNPGTLTVY